MATSPGDARAFTELVLKEWRCDELLDAARLVVSELVTNVVLHAGSDALLTLVAKPGVVRIEVADTSRAAPPVHDRRAMNGTSGRGIRIVREVADRFGVERDGAGKTVWAELRTA